MGEDKSSRRGREEERRQFEKQFSEDVRRFDLSRGEDVRRFNLGRDEDIRRYGLGQQELKRGQEEGARALSMGEEGLLQETSSALPELEQLRRAILSGQTASQGMADRRTSLALRESGVRGPEAALERSRQSGIRARDLEEMLAKYSLQEAQGRRDKRSSYFGEKALRGQQATF